MPRFRKGRDDADKLPRFEDVVERALKAIGREYDLRDDHVEIKLKHGWQAYTLDDLRRRCESRPPDTWLGTVTKDLRETVELAEREGPLPEWDEARTRLKLRMHLTRTVPPAYGLGVPFGDDVMGVLALDEGDSVRLVKMVDANLWGMPWDDVLHAARVNTQAESDLQLQRITLKDGAGEAVICSSQRWFGASQALWPEKLLGEIGRFGAIVATPTCHIAMAYAIEDHRALAAIDLLEPWAENRVKEGPNPISPRLHWWRPGSIEILDDDRREQLAAQLPQRQDPAPPPPPKYESASTPTRGTGARREQRPR